MTAQATILILLTALSMIPAEQPSAAVCQQGSLDGTRVRTNDCGDGSCGWYEVGSNGITDLGFGGSQPDTIYFEFYSPATGTVDLGSGLNSNYETCLQCILVRQDSGSLSSKWFFQTGGMLTIDAGTVPGIATNVGLSWSNVTLAEVTIDPITFASTLVQGGVCYDITSDTIFRSGFEAP
jgi:hypothetical protein